MIKQQIRCCKVLNEKILNLFEKFPREWFVAEKYRALAYADHHIAIGHDQVMMSPMLEANMLQALAIQPNDKILEIGTGSGFITTLLAHLGQHVYSIELFAEFVAHAQQRINAHKIDNVTLQQGNGYDGWDKQQPYDIICITGSVPLLTDSLRQQLAVGGRLFAIIGHAPVMEACLITRYTESDWQEKTLFETVIPPLIV